MNRLQQPKNAKVLWETDKEADDALAAKLAEESPLPVEDGIAVLPAQNAAGRSDVKPTSQPQLRPSHRVPEPASKPKTLVSRTFPKSSRRASR